MQTKYISLLAAAAATTVSAAEVKRVDVVHILETLHVGKHIPSFTPNKRSVNAIFERDDKEECQSSAISILRSAPTANRDLESWALTAETTDPCTLTAPSSLSSELLSYMTAVVEWSNEKADDMQELADKCLDGEDANGGELAACPTPGTVIFTAATTTETVQLKTVLETFATPGASSTGSGSDSAGGSDDTEKTNAAAPCGANLFAAVAAVGVAGFMIAA
ncbi:infection structure specific [Fusarium subglutinans]|uniref:Infection structure specific n=1 Tax=Gibberella subglutinans TaxID=42677 RepID=A0A8H5NYJ2_GIBSU|nr:infection structure specific [Fusarium subglutinans]KAF5584166.1 infection structure specific [Fusarium subglutinans]